MSKKSDAITAGITTIVVGLLVAAGTFYTANASERASNKASDSTVNSIRLTLQGRNAAQLTALRRSDYIHFLAEAEKFRNIANPTASDEAALSLQEGNSYINAGKTVQRDVADLFQVLDDPKTYFHHHHLKWLGDKTNTDPEYFILRNRFLTDASTELAR